jgi:hypothetical protein
MFKVQDLDVFWCSPRITRTVTANFQQAFCPRNHQRHQLARRTRRRLAQVWDAQKESPLARTGHPTKVIRLKALH